MQSIENLFMQITIITNCYKRVEKATGENFNIFLILGVEGYEEKTHSRFIAELLNANGRHGFDNLFLVKFLDLLGVENDFFNSNKYKVENERFIGNVIGKSGGRIDVLLTDDKNYQITIENEIYASEQPIERWRYFNYNPKAKSLYLTLYGSDSEQSFDKTKYIKISYSHFIVQWLVECQKIAVENPIVREAIRQYKNLLKKMTYQNINEKMNQEILSIIVGEGKKENFESLIRLVNLTNDIFKVAVKEHLYPTLDKLILKHGLTTNLDRKKFVNKDAPNGSLGFSIQNEQMTKNNIQIGFAFDSAKGANNLMIGFSYINQEIKNEFNYDKLIKYYEYSSYNGLESSEGWLDFQYFYSYRNWENLNDLKEIIHGNFKNDFTYKVETLLEIAENSF